MKKKRKRSSNRKILIAGHWTDLVNNSSYTDEDDGKAYTVVSAWKNFEKIWEKINNND